MPPGKIDVYNLGDMGIDVTRSPVHTKDGEFEQAQNVMATRSGGRHAIRKRFGLAKLNSTASAGHIWQLTLVSVLDPNAAEHD
jgi:hypothetical protein